MCTDLLDLLVLAADGGESLSLLYVGLCETELHEALNLPGEDALTKFRLVVNDPLSHCLSHPDSIILE